MSQYFKDFRYYSASSFRFSFICVCLFILDSLFSTAKSEEFFTMETLIENLSDKKTRAQRDSFWAKVNGQQGVVMGKVSNVKGSGFILPARIEMDLPPNWDNSAVCAVKPELEATIIDINIGDIVACVGNLENYSIVFGFTSIFLSDSDFKVGPS